MRTCDRAFEKMSSGLVKELSEKNERKSQKLLKRKLETWNRRNAFELADRARLMEFMQQDCCQTKIDKIWRGKLAVISMCRVRLRISMLKSHIDLHVGYPNMCNVFTPIVD